MATVNILPAADVSNDPAWTLSTGSDVYALLDDDDTGAPSGQGGGGGSGVVILRWATASATIGGTRTGLTDGGVQTDGSDSYIIFTAGTGVITFS